VERVVTLCPSEPNQHKVRESACCGNVEATPPGSRHYPRGVNQTAALGPTHGRRATAMIMVPLHLAARA
jgi:hypothetical protein